MKRHNAWKMFSAIVLVVCLMFAACGAFAEPSPGNLIHFVPTIITVESDSVTVEGYFINLNEDIEVYNYTDFEMDVYEKGELLVSGEFGDINQFTVSPMGAKFQIFTFNGSHDLNEGTYDCNDYFYTVVNCNFRGREV